MNTMLPQGNLFCSVFTGQVFAGFEVENLSVQPLAAATVEPALPDSGGPGVQAQLAGLALATALARISGKVSTMWGGNSSAGLSRIQCS